MPFVQGGRPSGWERSQGQRSQGGRQGQRLGYCLACVALEASRGHHVVRLQELRPASQRLVAYQHDVACQSFVACQRLAACLCLVASHQRGC